MQFYTTYLLQIVFWDEAALAVSGKIVEGDILLLGIVIFCSYAS
jgi:hypothetical protein